MRVDIPPFALHTKGMRIAGRPERRLIGVVQLLLIASGCGQIEESSVPAAPIERQKPLDDLGGSFPPEQSVSPDDMDQPEAEPENGQTGSATPTFCRPGDDARCVLDLATWTKPAGRAELVNAVCSHDGFSDALPSCHCTLRVERDGLREEVVTHPGSRPGGCSEYARTPDRCLYCSTEFPGCSVDDAQSCTAICAEMTARYDAELQKTFSATSRLARCGQQGECEYVTEIDGQCYARDPLLTELPVFDCSLPDVEILGHQNERNAGTCDERPLISCQTANDCPRGLACSDLGTCDTCGPTCSDANGRPVACNGQPSCAVGEFCVEGVCLLEANIDCVGFSQCGDGDVCVLSGMDLSAGRGNAATRSFCSPYPSD